MKNHLKKVLIAILSLSMVIGSSNFAVLAEEIGETVSENETPEETVLSGDRAETTDNNSVDQGSVSEAEAGDAEAETGTVSGDENISSSLDLFGNGMDIEGTDSVGNMLSEKIAGKADKQMENNGCNIFSVSMNGNMAVVDMETIEDAQIAVGIYDENTEKLLASGNADVKAGEKSVSVNIIGDMPQYYIVRAYMVGKDDLAPLCNEYETALFTEDMQTFLSKTTDDFDERLVLNYDNDKTKNFMVFNDRVLRIKGSSSGNTLISANEAELTYKFSNVDTSITGLSEGDIVSYEYGDNKVLLINVKKIEISNGDATIIGQKLEVDGVIDYIHVDYESIDNPDSVSVDTSNLPEGVTCKDNNSNNIESEESAGHTTKESIPPTTFGLDVHPATPVGISIGGEVTIGLDMEFTYVKTLFNETIELKMDYSLSLDAFIEGYAEIEKNLADFSFFAYFVKIGIEPRFVVSISGSVHAGVEINGTTGFRVEKPNKFINLTTKPEVLPFVDVEVTFFIGLKFVPYIAILHQKIADIEFSVSLGVEITAVLPLSSSQNKASMHECKKCVAGYASFVCECAITVTALLIEVDFIEPRGPVAKIPNSDFYWSIDFGDFGFGICPHRRELITFEITDRNKNAIFNADVTIKNKDTGEEYYAKSGRNGIAEIILAKGKYIATVSAQGFYDNSYNIVVGNKPNSIIKCRLIKIDEINDEKGMCVFIETCDYSSGAIDENGNLWMWGSNSYGNLGDGTRNNRIIPEKTKEGTKFKTLCLGFYHSGAIDENGNLWMWGENEDGVLGDGTKEDSYFPKVIMAGTKFKAISFHSEHSGAIDEDGNLWMWGDNSSGRLGDGIGYNTTVPINIMAGTKFKTLSLGYAHSGAIDEDGNLWMWGNNAYGQMGDGTKGNYSLSPVKIMEDTKFKTLSLGTYTSGAIDEDGNLWMWGDNHSGQFGDGTKNDSIVPKKIETMEGTRFKILDIADWYSGAIDEDGNLWMWGYNHFGKLGDGTTTDSLIPKKIKEDTRFKSLSLSNTHNGAIDEDGNLWMWGSNNYGNLGDGTTTDSLVPKTISLNATINNTEINNLNINMDIRNDLNVMGLDSDEVSLPDIQNNMIEYPVSGSYNINGSRIDFTGLDAASVYNVYTVKGKTDSNPLSANNLLYIAQAVTDGTGTLSVNYVPKETVDNPVIYAVKRRDPIRTVSVNDIGINKKELNLKKGESETLVATVYPEDANDRSVIWESSDTNVATVDNTGKVTAVSDGSIYISATSNDGGYHVCCNVYVGENDTPKPVQDDPDDGVAPGDLPDGKSAPEGIWVGGLKKSYPYTGNAIKPVIRVYKGETRLTANTDYTLSYKNNTNVGTNATITVKLKGDYSGSKPVTFAIEKNHLIDVYWEEDNLTVPYKKNKKHNNIKPVLTMNGVKLKYSARDFDIEYLDAKTKQESSCIDVGDYIISMTAKSESKGYTASIDVPLVVSDKPTMSEVTITPSKKNLPYNGTKQIPDFTLKYKGQIVDSGAYTMLTVSGDSYIEPGSHSVIFKGNGKDYIGSRKFTYKITGKRSLEDSNVTAVLMPSSLDGEGKVPYAYGGAKPKVIISYNGTRLKEGTHYTLSYKNNKKAGQTGTVTIRGKGSYKGSRPLTFTVSKRDLKTLLLTVNDRAESTRNEDYKKAPILFTDHYYTDQRLNGKKDYTAEFTVSSGSSNPKAGDIVTVDIEAKSDSNFKGSASTTFKIIEKSKDLSRAKVKINGNKAFEYTGKQIKPSGNEIQVTLDGKPVDSSDYDITAYYNNVKRGNNAVVVVTGKGDLSGSKAVKFKIGSSPIDRLWNGAIVFNLFSFLKGEGKALSREVTCRKECYDSNARAELMIAC